MSEAGFLVSKADGRFYLQDIDLVPATPIPRA